MWSVPSGPCWAGSAVTVTGDPTPARSTATDDHGSRPIAPEPSRSAPCTVVITRPARGRNSRPAGSRLSLWCSCDSSTTSIGGSASGSTAGPVVLTSPPAYSPGGDSAGSVSQRNPAYSSTAVGPPTSVIFITRQRSTKYVPLPCPLENHRVVTV